MPNPENKIPNEPRKESNIEMRRRLFRQTMEMGKIFIELLETDDGRTDSETGRVLLESARYFTDQAHVRRESKTWLRMGKRGVLEWLIEAREFSAKESWLRQLDWDEPESEDPFAHTINKIENEEILSRSESHFVLNPVGSSGEIEKKSSAYSFDEEGLLSTAETGTTYHSIDGEIAEKDLKAFHQQLLTQLKKRIYSLVSHKDPESYERDFPLTSRRRVLQFLLKEIRLAHHADRL